MFSKKIIRFQGLFLFLCLLTIMVGKAVAAEYWLHVNEASMGQEQDCDEPPYAVPSEVITQG